MSVGSTGAPEVPAAGGEQWPRPIRPTGPANNPRAMYRLGQVLLPNPAYRTVARALEAHPRAEAAFTAVERRVKERIFGCQMCGQCTLPATGYACPMTCPKQLRNGPCGGVSQTGGCEVFPDRQCVWVTAHDRAASAGHGDDLAKLQRPVDYREFGKSSWVNYWQCRDDDLWTDGDGLARQYSVRPPA